MSGRRLIIVTGLSGSGKSTVARALEDEGYFVVDNLPLMLLPRFLQLTEKEEGANLHVAIVTDVRSRNFRSEFETALKTVESYGFSAEIFFLDATEDVLIRRYSETRRRHPLAPQEGVEEGIRRERQILAGFRELATMIIDSSSLTPHQLRARVLEIIRGQERGIPLVVQLQSFGFRHGLPAGSDLVMDVRFLSNPHFVPELQPLTGLEEPVRDFVLSQQICREFLQHFGELVQFLLPHYQREGKSYLTVSIGCTGGRHRSVAVVEALRSYFRGPNITLEVTHRDISKR